MLSKGQRVPRLGPSARGDPGRHRADDNCFARFKAPDGKTTELSTEFPELDEDTWLPSLFDASEPETSDQWGR
ncbi:hypothetical protein DKG34_38370 [Streptomyces sp. NWU49]|nr:hypothetical protein DKG34_38370 [Streptomyces sp. NWU49]